MHWLLQASIHCYNLICAVQNNEFSQIKNNTNNCVQRHFSSMFSDRRLMSAIRVIIDPSEFNIQFRFLYVSSRSSTNLNLFAKCQFSIIKPRMQTFLLYSSYISKIEIEASHLKKMSSLILF